MLSRDELYDRAQSEGVEVYNFPFDGIRSISVPGAIGMDMRQMDSVAMEKTDLGHELGHNETGSFYTKDSPLDERARCERKANKRAAEHMLMPFDELVDAMANGLTEPWQLAEHFEITEDFVKVALDIYAERLNDAKVRIAHKEVGDVSIQQDGTGGYWIPEQMMHVTPGKTASPKGIRKSLDMIARLEAEDDSQS